jgi:SAM-dependent methyltransferase
MMEVVEHAGKIYPKFQTNGNAARFAMPFAEEVLSGKGLDIGCNRAEWAYPGAKMIDLEIDDEWHAFNLPDEKYDYIFSSHCLEHIPDWVGALNYWSEHLKPGGVMFLYLPHYSQTYWRPWNNRKHVNILTPEFIHDYFKDQGYHNILVSGADLYNAFYGVACK